MCAEGPQRRYGLLCRREDIALVNNFRLQGQVKRSGAYLEDLWVLCEGMRRAATGLGPQKRTRAEVNGSWRSVADAWPHTYHLGVGSHHIRNVGDGGEVVPRLLVVWGWAIAIQDIGRKGAGDVVAGREGVAAVAIR